MSDIHYNLQFEKLCSVLQLGEIVDVPEKISGGLLHRMYAIQTTTSKQNDRFRKYSNCSRA